MMIMMMRLQSATALMLLMGIIALVAGDDLPVPRGTSWCSNEEYTAADRFATDIDRVLRGLVKMDSEFLPIIDVNLYSPNHINPVAYGQRVCTDAYKLVPPCDECFREAQGRLVNDCQSHHKAGGQITLEKCFMRYEIYNFIQPKTDLGSGA